MPILQLAASRALPRARSSLLNSSSKVSRVCRRGYASGGPPKPAASEIPWIAGAGAATIGGLFLVAQSGTPKNPFVHPMPGDDYHGEGHDEHGEGEEEEEHEEEEAPAPSEETSSDEGTEESGDDSSSGQEHTPGQKVSGKKLTEEPADGKLKTPAKGVEGEADIDGNYELDRPDTDRKVIHRPDARGGYKRRLESPRGIKQGELVFDDENPDHDDSPAASKVPIKGSMSGRQYGLSNTDTKHSYNLQDMEHQKKDNGQPASSKSQGTINARPEKTPSATGTTRQTDEPQGDSSDE